MKSSLGSNTEYCHKLGIYSGVLEVEMMWGY